MIIEPEIIPIIEPQLIIDPITRPRPIIEVIEEPLTGGEFPVPPIPEIPEMIDDLNTGREFLACEKVVIDTKTFIFAIGGYGITAGSRLNSVEILEVGTNTWKTGKYQYNSTFLTK